MHLSLAAARKYALIICMCLLAIIGMRLLTVRTHAIYRIQITARLSDEDAVYLIECCRRSPYLQEG